MKKFSAMLALLALAAMVMSFTSGDNDLAGQEIVYIQSGSASCAQAAQTFSSSCAGSVPGGNGGGQPGFEGYSVPSAYYAPRVVYGNSPRPTRTRYYQPRYVQYAQPRYVQYAQPRFRQQTVRYSQPSRYYNGFNVGIGGVGLNMGWQRPGYSRSFTYPAQRGFRQSRGFQSFNGQYCPDGSMRSAGGS